MVDIKVVVKVLIRFLVVGMGDVLFIYFEVCVIYNLYFWVNVSLLMGLREGLMFVVSGIYVVLVMVKFCWENF